MPKKKPQSLGDYLLDLLEQEGFALRWTQKDLVREICDRAILSAEEKGAADRARELRALLDLKD